MPVTEHQPVWPQAVSEIELGAIRSRLRERIATLLELESHPAAAAVEAQPSWRSAAMPREPVPAADYYRRLADEALPAAAPVFSPRCMAHMTSVVPEVLWPAAELVVALNQNMVKRDASGVFTLIERQTVGALHRLVYERPDSFYDSHIQCDDSTLGIVTSGGTASNLSALWIARNRALGPEGGFPGVERAGLAAALTHHGCSRAVIVGSRLLHYSFEKAASVLGLGSDACVTVPLDADRRIRLDALADTLAACRARGERVIALIGIAGATECGTIDPLGPMADLAAAEGIWFHVDAAWGGPLLFSARHASKLDGIARADSVAFDGHKQVHLPIGSGVLLLGDPHAAAVIEKRAHYMLQESSGDLGMRSLDGSRPCSALLMHAALHLVGPRGYEQLIDRSIENARFMASNIERRRGFELLVRPHTNIVLYRLMPPAWRDAACSGLLTIEQHELISDVNSAVQRSRRCASVPACRGRESITPAPAPARRLLRCARS
jgi:glutamate decarboxylase